jgi:NAD(P)-dependent dehydrogenase (short-subunit alcohol dehydrogenase family)
MQAIMETIFESAYLLTALIFGVVMLVRGARGDRQSLLFGIMSIVLAGGDAFHLFPRMLALNTDGLANHAAALGIGTLVTSITMTVFYVMLYHVWCLRYKKRNAALTVVIYALAAVRVVLCALPQNDWTNPAAPYAWGIFRNIPFVMMGLLILYLWIAEARKNADRPYRFMGLAIGLSFLFYMAVVLFADAVPPVGMLMLPKTVCYVWMLLMPLRAYREKTKANAPQVILISGGSSGIGREAAIGLAKAGHIVYAAARRVERMTELAALGIRTLRADVTVPSDLEALVATVVAERGRIDVLINNAGYGAYGALEDVPIEEARRQLDVNLFGLADLTRLVLPYMRAQKSGRIINIASIAGKIGIALGGWYHAAKFAVEGLSDCLRQEVAPFGIKVVVIEPGGINTEWSKIARERLLEVSKDGAYAPQAEKTARLFFMRDGGGSDPRIVARTIARAVAARNPKTRYAPGKLAKPAVFGRKVFSDKFLDRVMRILLK